MQKAARASAWLALLTLVALLAGCIAPAGTSTTAGGGIALAKVVDGLDQPVFAAFPGDGLTYLVEQGGTIRTWDGTTLAPWLDIQTSVATGGERGLLGLAFEPNSHAQRFVIYYTGTNGDIHIDRYVVSSGKPVLLNPLLTIAHHTYGNHNGGMVAYGPDGMLYIGVGDGGSGGDPDGHGQDTNVLLGKILRIDPSHPSATKPYSIPADNPFARGGGAPEVWAYGLRNPWRFSFDRQTGSLWIGDVGQDQWEEVNLQGPDNAGGNNYGWNLFEGTHAYAGNGHESGTIKPIAEYDHSGSRCSITGGYLYRGTTLPSLVGSYLYADYCSGEVWALARSASGWSSTLLMQSGHSVSSFGEDTNGELYLVDLQGALYKFVPSATASSGPSTSVVPSEAT